MGTVHKFEDLAIWQKARLLSKKIYPITSSQPLIADPRIRNQMRGSAGSIMDNIAEGFERGAETNFAMPYPLQKVKLGN